MRIYIDCNDMPQLARLPAADHEADDFICFFGNQGSALPGSQVILKLDSRIGDFVAKRSLVDLIKALEVRWSVLANIHGNTLEVTPPTDQYSAR